MSAKTKRRLEDLQEAMDGRWKQPKPAPEVQVSWLRRFWRWFLRN